MSFKNYTFYSELSQVLFFVRKCVAHEKDLKPEINNYEELRKFTLFCIHENQSFLQNCIINSEQEALSFLCQKIRMNISNLLAKFLSKKKSFIKLLKNYNDNTNEDTTQNMCLLCLESNCNKQLPCCHALIHEDCFSHLIHSGFDQECVICKKKF